jgi:hypothetical protein
MSNKKLWTAPDGSKWEELEIAVLETNQQIDLINERMKNAEKTLINNRNMLKFNNGTN